MHSPRMLDVLIQRAVDDYHVVVTLERETEPEGEDGVSVTSHGVGGR